MRRTMMQLSGREHLLADGQDVDQSNERALAAVRGHGALITVMLEGGDELDLLVSTGIPLAFRNVEIPDGREAAPLTSAIELARYDDWFIQ
ncbi:hypothetical protein ITJ42_16005 [Clavibacter michiganensis subsp. phaseoli]|uniref:Uncharacterized protein n=1 Tax=Clavibacter phaseoli TaxID=1734031 RepID=A0A8I0S9R7_9MICO|nr:hypothetical protein [Clavibacter phaseoli]MBF4632724.1 hypothetical protein [Clavibacter phaseoli]